MKEIPARSPGGRWKKLILERVEFDERESVLVNEAAKVMNRLEEIATALEGEPLVVPGTRPGHVIAHPLLDAERAQRALLRGLLRDLEVPEDESAYFLEPVDRSEQARKAARARWDKTG